MKCFEHNGNQCISINGKDYFLLRGYMSEHKFIFVQLTGSTPLHKEDMPSKDWEILTTKAGKEKVWTAYKKTYFKYGTEKDCPDLAFIGATTQGSYFLALKWLAKRFNHNIPDEELHNRAGQLLNSEYFRRTLTKCNDKGNSGEDALLLHFGITTDEEDVIQILKGELT